MRTIPSHVAMLLVLVSAHARANPDVTIEPVAFAVPTRHDKSGGVAGILRLPRAEPPLPAVILVGSSPGLDGRSAFYAPALNAAGIATLEIDVTVGRGMAASPHHHLPNLFASLEKLAADPRIDASRVGVMGFSYGGTLALLATSEPLLRELPTQRRFAAHLPLYPVCWLHVRITEGRSRWKGLGRHVYREVTGRPVHILVGDRDDYDRPGDCAAFRAALDEKVRGFYALTVYPEATFGWDSPFGSKTWNAGAHRGTGGMVEIRADPELAGASRAFAVEFFSEALSKRPGAVRQQDRN
jgi:uncharacterized protein